jgi:FRG domain
MATYKTVKLNTSEEYLEYLSLTNNQWFKDDAVESHWIFRGQNNADDCLIPSLYRKGEQSQEYNYNKILDKISTGQGDTIVPDLRSAITSYIKSGFSDKEKKYKDRLQEIVESVFVELELTELFLKKANMTNLDVPTLILFKQQPTSISSLYYFYSHLDKCIESFINKDEKFTLEDRKNITDDKRYINSKDFYKIDFPEAFALSRHHGIPGRYLDWTRNPLYAAYFSIQGVENMKGKEICVWALNTDTHANIKFHKYLHHKGLKFLYRQRGLFTEMQGIEGYYYLNGYWPSIDEYLMLDDNPIEDYLQKVTLPASQASNVLKALKRGHINSYNLMPTYDKVSESVLIDVDYITGEKYKLKNRKIRCKRITHFFVKLLPWRRRRWLWRN